MPVDDIRTRRGARVRRRAIRGLLGTAAVLAATTLVALSFTGGSLARWVDTAAARPGVVTTGSAELDVAADFTASNWGNLLVGESVRQPFTVINTGDVPLDLAATGSAAAGYELRAVRGACPVSAIGGAALDASPSAFGSALAPGASAHACLEVRLVAGAVAGSTSNVSVAVTGTQVR